MATGVIVVVFIFLVAVDVIDTIGAGSVDPVGGIIATVDEEVETLQTRIGVVNDVRRKESAQGGIVIPALEVVEAGLSIVDVATKANLGHFRRTTSFW